MTSTLTPITNGKKYDFTGKVALVTGSSSGIGAAIATQLAEYGASVTITGRDAAALNSVAANIEKLTNRKPLQLVGDILDSAFVKRLVDETVAKYGRLDILVNNAGRSTPVNSYDDEQLLPTYDKVMGINVRAVVQLTQHAVPHLEKTKGNIVNISSVVSMKPLNLIYSTSKAALDMVTRCTANLLADKGIRVNSVNPGAVATKFGRSIGLGDDMPSNKMIDTFVKQTTPLKRWGDPVDIANLVSFLLSNDAVNMTGSVVVNDGGSMVHAPKF